MGSKAIKMKDTNGNLVYPCPYYPVGSIYMSVNNINPSEFFGGTWEQIEGRFLLGVGSTTDDAGDTRFYGLGATGGEFAHRLTIDELAYHSHVGIFCDKQIYVHNGGGADGYSFPFYDNNGGYATQIGTGATGGNQYHNNMPPFLAVYIWKRTA